jgi:osmotically-inducible protein OsmY
METFDAKAREIRDRVQTTIARLGGNAAQIHVGLNGTCATLKGEVRTWAEHEAAESAALATPGIVSVDNQLCLQVKGKLTAS